MLSYELSQVAWLCYSLGLLFHYSTLVTLNWMASLPVVMAIEVFKRLWYEKVWIIAPLAAFSTSKSTLFFPCEGELENLCDHNFFHRECKGFQSTIVSAKNFIFL
jgi:hypothetical protein